MTTERRFDAGMRETETDAPGLVLGDDGVVYLVAPDGTRTAVGGGGSQPVTRAQYTGHNVAIDADAFTAITWDEKVSGTDLLDLTDPANPTVVEAGVYAITAYVAAISVLTVGIYFNAILDMDASGADAEGSTFSAPAISGHLQPGALVVCTFYVPAGGIVQMHVQNYDSVTKTFALQNVVVQRLSGPE